MIGSAYDLTEKIADWDVKYQHNFSNFEGCRPIHTGTALNSFTAWKHTSQMDA